MRVKMSKQPPPAPTASAIGSCLTIIQIVGRPSETIVNREYLYINTTCARWKYNRNVYMWSADTGGGRVV